MMRAQLRLYAPQCRGCCYSGGRAVTAEQSRKELREFLEAFAKRNGIARVEDWKAVTAQRLASAGGETHARRHRHSVHAMLLAAFPEERGFLVAPRFRKKLPNAYWTVLENRRLFLEDLAGRHGLERIEELCEHGEARKELLQSSLVRHYGGSLRRVLVNTFPGAEMALTTASASVDWDGSGKRPRGYWASKERQAALMAAVGEKAGVRDAQDWAGVSAADVRRMGGGVLLNRYGSLPELIAATVGEEAAMASKERVARYQRRIKAGHWSDREKRRTFLQQIAATCKVEQLSDWRKVTDKDARKLPGGSGFMDFYRGSLFRAIQDLWGTPNVSVCEVRRSVPQESWSNTGNIVSFLETVREELCLEEKADWFRISGRELRSVPGGFSFTKSGMSLRDALAIAYPNETWPSSNPSEGLNMKKSHQRTLRVAVGRLFPGQELKEDFRTEFSVTEEKRAGPGLELDIFLPNHRLAFEYNGVQHYEETVFFGPLEPYQRRDAAKREACKEHGIRLLEVPYWWDGQVESLAASLHQRYPGLLGQDHPPPAPASDMSL